MKVGIASCYFHHNYGSMLQAYATQMEVEKLGHEAITICCNKPIQYMQQSMVAYLFHKITNPDIVKKKIREYQGRKKLEKYPDVQVNMKQRNERFDAFYKKNFNLSYLCADRKELEAFAGELDAVIVGSDMLWHPVNVEHDYYTLTFVPDCTKKISYATSFGTVVIPKYQREKYIDFLSRFDFISVREQSGISVIKQLGIDKMASVVLDPTLLFTGEEWFGFQAKEPIIKEDYILCYFLGVNQQHREFARCLKKMTGYKLVALQHLDEFVVGDIGFADLVPYDIGPIEFLNLIRNAKYVCTDSFHGTCFSILNHKKFLTFNRFSSSNSQSTNTRIDSLCSMLGLGQRRINIEEHPENILEKMEVTIDYDTIDSLLQIERNKSIDFLKMALKP